MFKSKSEIMGEILAALRKYESFLISSHINPDGDAIGSQLAVHSLLSGLGKTVSVANLDPVPFAYKFLPNASVLQCTKLDSNTHPGLSPDLQRSWENVEVAVVLDCAGFDRVGKELVQHIHPKHALINIDHHGSNDHFGTLNLVDTSACATGELIFSLMEYGGFEIGRDRAECLYTAILTDTGSFRFSNTTPNAHRIAGRLIEEGISPDRIARMVYEVIPYQRAKLFGMALETLQLSSDGKVAWVSVTQDMFQRTGTGSEDTEDFIDYVRSLKGIEIAGFFRELEDGGVKVSLRSKTGLRVDEIAAMFGGGGHKAAAGCSISEPLDKAIEMVLEVLRSRMQEHP